MDAAAAPSHLLCQPLLRDGSEGLQVRVQAAHPGQRDPEAVLGDEPEGDVVREADGLPGALEGAGGVGAGVGVGLGGEPGGERPAEADAGAAGGEPEADRLLAPPPGIAVHHLQEGRKVSKGRKKRSQIMVYLPPKSK